MTAAVKRRSPAGVPVLERTLGMVECLSACPKGVTLSDLARLQKIPKNTTYRILNTLCARGYVTRDEPELTYRLTRKFVTLVYASAQDGGLIEKALGPMRALRDQVKETVVISIVDAQEGIVLEQVPGLYPFRFVCEPGTRQPLHASASTKVLLAQMEADRLEPILASLRFTRLTDRTITGLPAFRRELERTRARGFGVDCGEALNGVSCVAAAILDRQQRPVAAITVTGPDERLHEKDFGQVGALVKSCAQVISTAIV